MRLYRRYPKSVAKRSLATYITLFPLWLLVFTSASQTIIVTPILPIIGEALDVAESQRGLLISVYSWILAVAALIMGPISDKIGRRKILLLGSFSLVIVLLLHGFVQSFTGLLFVRALAGAAGGILSGAAVSYVGDAFPYEQRGWANGWIMSGVSFGLVMGIPLGRILATAAGFRMPFLAFALLAAIAFVLILWVVPQPRVERDTAPISLGNSLRRYRSLLQESAVRAATVTFFLMFLGLGLLMIYLPQWLTDLFPLDILIDGIPLALFGLPVDFIALLFFVGGIMSVVTGPSAGALSDKIGRKPLILLSCVGLFIVTLSLTYLVTERWVAFPVYVAIMGLFAMRMSPIQALVTELVPARLRGSLLALTVAIGQIGIGLGATLSGSIYASMGYRASTFASAFVVMLLALIVWKHLPEPESPKSELVLPETTAI